MKPPINILDLLPLIGLYTARKAGIKGLRFALLVTLQIVLIVGLPIMAIYLIKSI